MAPWSTPTALRLVHRLYLLGFWVLGLGPTDGLSRACTHCTVILFSPQSLERGRSVEMGIKDCHPSLFPVLLASASKGADALGRAGQGRTGQGRTGQGRAGQGRHPTDAERFSLGNYHKRWPCSNALLLERELAVRISGKRDRYPIHGLRDDAIVVAVGT